MEKVDASTRLREAIILNDLSLVKRLLSNDVSLLQNPNYDDKSNTSLHLAARYGHIEIAEHLILLGHDRAADIELSDYMYAPKVDNLGISVNTDGHCPLHHAAICSQPAVADILCTNFPDTVDRPDNKGCTPLHYASSAHAVPGTALGCMDRRVGKGTARPAEDISLIEILLRHGANVNAQDEKGNTCLHNATAWGNLKAVRALIQAGCDPLCQNKDGWTPQYYSLTVQAEVYYRALVAEWEKRKAEEKIRANERRNAKGVGGLRIVDQDDEDDGDEGEGRSRARSQRSQTTSTTVSESDRASGLGISVGSVGSVDAWK